MNHGHVTPNPDGSKARCGGPGICSECSVEAGLLNLSRIPSEPPKEPQPSQGAGAEEYKQKQNLVEKCWRNPTRIACLALYEDGYAAGRASQDARIEEMRIRLECAIADRNAMFRAERSAIARAALAAMGKVGGTKEGENGK